MAETQLNPCPFCGSVPLREDIKEVSDGEYLAVHCLVCDGRGPLALDAEEAGILWDTRAE